MPELEFSETDTVKKVLCSTCRKEFKAGQKYFGQAFGTFQNYGYVQGKDGTYAVPLSEHGGSVILDYFHEECLR